MTSVCTGSLVYADAGLLDGRAATTYWSAFDELLSLGHDIEPRRDDRFVDTGEVVTAAGVSAGIDMSLWVVGQLYGVDHARGVQRMMEYDPAPPYAADV
jgi:transcriptional regulator GlxA family with amidase domain